ncbi:MAG TPA: sugar ABC transporter substrate-binding protein [Baekduia sp.]|nr:sugar ABC transporter substrate-binding protein [Baekduia sp.]
MRIRGRKAAGLAGLIAAGALAVAGCGGQGATNDSAGSSGGGGGGGGGGKDKVFVALSYSGNAWQDEAANLALAIARADPDVTVEKQIAGTDAQAQISQYQSMIAAGAKAIVSFPVSPTALNSTIRQGCQQGVKFFMYDATVTEPCAWNVSYITGAPKDRPDQPFFGAQTAQALVDLLHGQGNIFMSRGVPGNSVDETHYNSAMGIFKKHPGIHVLATYYGMWDGSTTQKETSKALAAHPNVDGIWAEAGEAGAIKALEAANHAKIPVTGENSNYFRQALKGGWNGVSSGSPPATAGIAMKLALKVLKDGDDSVPKNVELHLPWVPADQVKVCSGDAFTNGCNVFPAGKVPDEFVTEIFNQDLLPETSLTAAQSGHLAKGTSLQPLPSDLGEWTQPPSRRYVTRNACDDGWKPGMLPSGVKGCVQG